MIDTIITDTKTLSQVSRPTTWEEVKSLNLAARLADATMLAWTRGSGLAAIQIGLPLRFAWYRYNELSYQLLNPEIIGRLGKALLIEGCLSIPHKWLKIERSYEIEYTSDGKKMRAKGLRAQIIQHEIDHMDGKLITFYEQK